MTEMDDDTTLESLPRLQRHDFEPWSIDDAICERCGGPRQAHPADAARPGEEGG